MDINDTIDTIDTVIRDTQNKVKVLEHFVALPDNLKKEVLQILNKLAIVEVPLDFSGLNINQIVYRTLLQYPNGATKRSVRDNKMKEIMMNLKRIFDGILLLIKFLINAWEYVFDLFLQLSVTVLILWMFFVLYQHYSTIGFFHK